MADIELKDLREKDMIITRHNNYIFSEINKHWHSYYEIELVLDGEGKHIINDRVYEEKPHDAFVMRLNDFHEFKLDRKGNHLVVDVPAKYIPRDIEEFLTLVKGDIFVRLNEEDFVYAHSLYKMIRQIGLSNGAFEKAQKTYLACSLIMFILSRMDENVSEKYSETNLRLREIISFINKNLQNEITTEIIASKFYISKRYLERFFKKNTGVTLQAYIRKIRLEHAMEMLMNTDKNVTEISESVGFSSVSTFFRVFKEEYGESPTNVRRRKK